MILAGKAFCLLLVFLFSPAMVFGGIHGTGIKAGNALLVACGVTGFITLQWLL